MEYGFNSDMQYFEMIVKYFKDGEIQKSKDLFLAMPRKERKGFVKSIYHYWNIGLTHSDKIIFFELL